jgi:hypothetical protein
MKTLSCGILAAIQLAGTRVAVAQTGAGLVTTRQAPVIVANNTQVPVPGSGGTSPAITISARTLDFGSVCVGSIKKLSFMVQNVGGGILMGAANVSPPFSILGGSPCVLKPVQTQVITVQYAPKSIGVHMTVVHLTGADGAAVTVMGSAAPPSPAAPARRPPALTEPAGPRLIARD